MPKHAGQVSEYHCPGEADSLSRAVHLGRLARFYPGCRQCPHRDDTGTLSARQVKRLKETRPRGRPRPLFHDEGAGGVYLNDLGPATARDVAAAFGFCLQRRILGAEGPPDRVPEVAIAGDGRPLSCELVAAVGEGLRWAGCHVVDVGPASAACLALAIHHLRISGGVLVGNPGDRPYTVGLKFWAPGPRPLSAGGPLDRLRQIHQAGFDRPTRTYGALRRFQAEAPYLAGLAGYYHALRPLRFVLAAASAPLARYLKKLTGPVACRIIPGRGTLDGVPRQILAEEADFGACIDGDGETCRLLDEQGRRVSPDRLLLLVARHLLQEDPRQAVVLEERTPPPVAAAIGSAGGRVLRGDSRRAEMERVIRGHRAAFGGGPSGRFWYTALGPPLPDALMTLTWLLVILSRSDCPLSEVLDREAGLG